MGRPKPSVGRQTKRTTETALNLSDLDLEVLPESVCRLPRLRFLYLNNNRLTQLPKWIGQLAQLQELTLVGNRLTKLPEDALRTLLNWSCFA